MLSYRLDEDLNAGDFNLPKFLASGNTSLGGRPSRASIGDEAALIYGAEVAASGHVARSDGHVDSQRFEDAPPDPVFQRIVTE